MRTLLNTTLYFYNITLIYQPVCLVNTVPQRPYLRSVLTAGCPSALASSADSSSAIFDCKHPADFKRTAVSGRKATGAILAVLMSTTGENLLGEIT